MFKKSVPLYFLVAAFAFIFSPAQAFALDGNVGNEVLDTANATLIRTGTGTTADPYKLQLNLGNANTWTGTHIFNGTLTANGITNIGDGGDLVTLSGSKIGLNVGDNSSDALDMQQGSNNYINVNTTDNSENVSFGNTTTNPLFQFLGTGSALFNGGVTVANGRTLSANGIVSLGDSGDAASISATTIILSANGAGNDITANLVDNNTDSLDIQQGTNNYLNVKTTDGGENISFGNAATNPTFNFLGTGQTNFIGSVSATGTISASNTFVASGNTTFSPGGTADITINTDTDSRLVVSGLQSSAGTGLCINGSNEMVTCSGASSHPLQNSYNDGNSITTTDARDIDFTLADTATDSNLDINLAADNTVSISRNDDSSTEAPSQLLLLENLDTDLAVNKGLSFNSASGGITTAIDASDAEIGTALAAGANDLDGTNWSITGSTGNIQTSGDISVGGGDLTTTATTTSVFNTGATTVNIAGAATSLNLGASVGNATIRNSTVSLPNATGLVANSATAFFDSINAGGGYGSTGATVSSTGNISTNGNLTVDGTSSIAGNATVAGNTAINGGSLTTTSSTGNLFNTSATTLNIGGAATSVSVGASSGTTTVNNALTVNGSLTANDNAVFSPGGTNGVTVNTDADSTFALNGLQTATGDGLCIDASSNVIKCSGTPSDRRLKQNITPLGDTLSRVLQLRGVRYDKLTDSDVVVGHGKRIGFIAQELEALYPELVYTDHNGIKSVDYEKMTAVLVESTKEQQKQIDDLKQEVEQLKTLINR